MNRHALFVHDNRSLGGVGHVSQQIEEGLRARGWSVDDLQLASPRSAFAHLARVDRMKGVIVATQNFSAAYIACALAGISRRPWVLSVHGPIARVLEVARPGAAKRALLRYTYKRAPAVVCSSQASLDSLRGFGTIGEHQNVRVIRNTAAPSFFAPAPAPQAVLKRLGFVGRLSEEKRPHVVVEMLKYLPSGWQLDMVGTGPLASGLVDQARTDIAAGRVRFAGQQRIDAATYRQWDATVLASAYEGYPLVLLESLASGVPVISVPIPPAVEMLGQHAPYMLARDDSPQALADAVQALLSRDPSQVARDIADINADHDPQAFIAAWDELLTGCLQR